MVYYNIKQYTLEDIKKYIYNINNFIKKVNIIKYEEKSYIHIYIKLHWICWLLFGVMHYHIKSSLYDDLRHFIPIYVTYNIEVR